MALMTQECHVLYSSNSTLALRLGEDVCYYLSSVGLSSDLICFNDLSKSVSVFADDTIKGVFFIVSNLTGLIENNCFDNFVNSLNKATVSDNFRWLNATSKNIFIFSTGEPRAWPYCDRFTRLKFSLVSILGLTVNELSVIGNKQDDFADYSIFDNWVSSTLAALVCKSSQSVVNTPSTDGLALSYVYQCCESNLLSTCQLRKKINGGVSTIVCAFDKSILIPANKVCSILIRPERIWLQQLVEVLPFERHTATSIVKFDKEQFLQYLNDNDAITDSDVDMMVEKFKYGVDLSMIPSRCQLSNLAIYLKSRVHLATLNDMVELVSGLKLYYDYVIAAGRSILDILYDYFIYEPRDDTLAIKAFSYIMRSTVINSGNIYYMSSSSLRPNWQQLLRRVVYYESKLKQCTMYSVQNHVLPDVKVRKTLLSSLFNTTFKDDWLKSTAKCYILSSMEFTNVLENYGTLTFLFSDNYISFLQSLINVAHEKNSQMQLKVLCVSSCDLISVLKHTKQRLEFEQLPFSLSDLASVSSSNGTTKSNRQMDTLVVKVRNLLVCSSNYIIIDRGFLVVDKILVDLRRKFTQNRASVLIV